MSQAKTLKIATTQKMVIEIRKSDKEEYKDTIRISKLQPFEYAIMSKDEFMEPLTGEGQYGEWAKYNMLVHEFKTANPQTGEPVVSTPNEVYGYFASGVSLIPKLVGIEVGQKFKLTQVQPEGKAYAMYKIELIGEDGSLTDVRGKSSSSSSTPAKAKETKKEEPVAVSQTLDDKIKIMKAGGVFNDSVAQMLAIEFDTTKEFVNKRATVL